MGRFGKIGAVKVNLAAVWGQLRCPSLSGGREGQPCDLVWSSMRRLKDHFEGTNTIILFSQSVGNVFRFQKQFLGHGLLLAD